MDVQAAIDSIFDGLITDFGTFMSTDLMVVVTALISIFLLTFAGSLVLKYFRCQSYCDCDVDEYEESERERHV